MNNSSMVQEDPYLEGSDEELVEMFDRKMSNTLSFIPSIEKSFEILSQPNSKKNLKGNNSSN